MEQPGNTSPNCPFIIFGLPRSRTAWLASFLSDGDTRVGHDIAIEADTFGGLLDRLYDLSGTIETGAMIGWRLLRHAIPGARMVTIRRPVQSVIRSLANLGVTGVDDEIIARDKLLDEVEAAGALRVEFDTLRSPETCGALFEILTGRRFDFHRWVQYDRTNIQIDLPGRLHRLAERGWAVQALKDEVAYLTAQIDGPKPTQFVRITREPFRHFWSEAAPLAEAHHREVNGGERKNHPFRFNAPLVARMDDDGLFRVYTARVNGVLAAYCTWTISPDVESMGVILADQGGWYVRPESAFKRLHLGRRVLEHSISDLKRLGVHSLQFHHQLNGRGGNAGVLLKRLGAEPVQHRYAMWIT